MTTKLFFLASCFAFGVGCKRYEATQTVLSGPDVFDHGCYIVTDVWDRGASSGNQLIKQFDMPCDAATDSSRAADLKKAQSIVDQLNKINQ